jgi:hypothetical protein
VNPLLRWDEALKPGTRVARDSHMTISNPQREDDLPSQRSSRSSSATRTAPLSEISTTSTTEPLPANELPAASLLADDRREQSRAGATRFWWPIALLMAVVATIVVVSALSDRSGGVRGPADEAAPGTPAAQRPGYTDPGRSP